MACSYLSIASSAEQRRVGSITIIESLSVAAHERRSHFTPFLITTENCFTFSLSIYRRSADLLNKYRARLYIARNDFREAAVIGALRCVSTEEGWS